MAKFLQGGKKNDNNNNGDEGNDRAGSNKNSPGEVMVNTDGTRLMVKKTPKRPIEFNDEEMSRLVIETQRKIFQSMQGAE